MPRSRALSTPRMTDSISWIFLVAATSTRHLELLASLLLVRQEQNSMNYFLPLKIMVESPHIASPVRPSWPHEVPFFPFLSKIKVALKHKQNDEICSKFDRSQLSDGYWQKYVCFERQKVGNAKSHEFINPLSNHYELVIHSSSLSSLNKFHQIFILVPFLNVFVAGPFFFDKSLNS